MQRFFQSEIIWIGVVIGDRRKNFFDATADQHTEQLTVHGVVARIFECDQILEIARANVEGLQIVVAERIRREPDQHEFYRLLMFENVLSGQKRLSQILIGIGEIDAAHAGDAFEIEPDFGVTDAGCEVINRISFDATEITEPRLRYMIADGEVDDVVMRDAVCDQKICHAPNIVDGWSIGR